MQIKLAEALLRRKELQLKVTQLHSIKTNDAIYEIRAQRIKVTDGLEDLAANYPKLTASQVTSEYDYYSKALRLIDGYIQQQNWTVEFEVPTETMTDFIPFSDMHRK